MRFVKLLPGLLAIGLAVSCDPQDSPYPYFKFDKTDRARFVAYQENERLVFENQSGNRRIYKVVSVVQCKSEYTVGMGITQDYAAKYYDYDERIITFKNQDGKLNQWEINYTKQPDFDSLAKSDYKKIRLRSGMNMWEWNGNGGIYPINLDDKTDLVSLTVGGQKINGVQKISSRSLYGYKSGEPARLDNTINTVYIKEQVGILGFGDIDGNLWLKK